MENAFIHLLDTYVVLPDTIKALWLIMPPLFFIAVILLFRMGRPPQRPVHYNVTWTDEGHFIAIPSNKADKAPIMMGINDEKPEELARLRGEIE